jgi:hypothetical protein
MDSARFVGGYMANLRLIQVWILATLVGMAGVRWLPAQEEPTGWSSPELVVQTNGTLAISNLALVADRAGQLHLFYPHQPDTASSYGIDYACWDGVQWSEPVNIMVNADGSDVRDVRAAIDLEQVVHLVWGGGKNTLYYASAPAARVGSAQAWSGPNAIATALTEAGIVSGPDGALYVAYADDPALERLSLIRSDDHGAVWSTPVQIAATHPGSMPGEVGLAIDGTGRLHASWTEHTLPSGSPLTGVYYTRSTDGGLTWEPPFQVDGERHGQIGVAAVGNDEIHLVWRSNIGGDGTFHRWSGDGGGTWAPPDVYDDRGGISGLPSFALDSAGALHYVIGPAYVNTWQNGVLGPYVGVAGQQLRSGDRNAGWSPPERADLAITSGNRLHVVFETGFQKLWHTTRRVDAPLVSPLPLPTPQATSVGSPTSPTAGAQGVPEPTATTAMLAMAPEVTSASPLSPVVAGVGASVVVVLIVMAIYSARRRT